MNVRKTVTVKGIVQGVNFRYYTQREAVKLGVTGWVRNLPNGDVEGCFEGSAEAVEALIDWCGKGPSRARVDSVTVEEAKYQGAYTEFLIER